MTKIEISYETFEEFINAQAVLDLIKQKFQPSVIKYQNGPNGENKKVCAEF